MKRLIIITIALFATSSLIAQEEEENSDTTRISIKNNEIIIVKNDSLKKDNKNGHNGHSVGRDDLTYWSGFEVGINTLVNTNFENSFDSKHLDIDPSQSFMFSFNFFEKRLPIIKDYFGIVTGLGITNSRYGFKDNHLRLRANADSTFGYVDTTVFNGFSKNQLRVNTLNIPLLFQINTSKNENKNFHIAFGAIGGVRIGSNVKYKYDIEGGGDTKNKEKGRYNLNAFQLTGTVRMGYNDFGLFANYNLIPLFENNKSELAFPLSFGASFHF